MVLKKTTATTATTGKTPQGVSKLHPSRSEDTDCSTTVTSNSSYESLSDFVVNLTSCGTGEYFVCSSSRRRPSGTMQRRSVSRRSLDYQSPSVRSRSVERYRHEEEELDGGSTAAKKNLDFENSKNHVVVPSEVVDRHGDKEEGEKMTLDRPHELHHRAMSDPFDTQQQDTVSTDEEEDSDLFDESSIIADHTVLPTFPRYPVKVNRDKNCWSEPPISIFNVRGPNYLNDKVKVPSSPYLLQSRGSDLFLTDPHHPVELDHLTHSILGGQLRKKPTMAIIFRFPWGYMNLYFELPANLAVYMQPNPPAIMDEELSVPEKTLAKWLVGDDDYKNKRLKLISYVAEGPWVVRNMVTGRPALIGTKLPVSYSLETGGGGSHHNNAPLLTATLDIGSSSNTAKRIVSVCRRYMSALTVDIGFVIQAESKEELPEQMLGALRLHGPDPLKATKLE